MHKPVSKGRAKSDDVSTVQEQRGGEEEHVAIPTVTFTSNLMYQQ